MRKQYTPAEIALIRKYYPLGGASMCLMYITGKTHDGISFKARSMGLVAP